ncbi:MAG: hypothetical protein O2960_13675 [Verrucomicrobia bacterium]|nr:hypothetical protein [Verrucomicrobiota bacterium]
MEMLRKTLHASIDHAIDGIIKSGIQTNKPSGEIPRHDPMTSPHRFFTAQDLIAEVQEKLKDDFTIHDVKHLVETNNKRVHLSFSAYSAALSSLAKQGHLELILPGSGRRPAKYRRRI